MTTPTALRAAPAPWAFYAPTADERITAALDLAGIRPGERFIDLGCGDGRVLVEAAARGARVHGIELDPDLAGYARENLARAGYTGTVESADFFEANLDADVLYAYLTPAILARLRDRFAALPAGTRIVTPVYGIAGWETAASSGGCHLFRLPAAPEAPPSEYGWLVRGTVLSTPAGRHCLVPLYLSAPAGPVRLEVESETFEWVRLRPGLGYLDSPGVVPVDFIANGAPVGHCTRAIVRAGRHEIDLAVVSASDGFGRREFSANEGFAFQRELARRIAAARSGGGS